MKKGGIFRCFDNYAFGAAACLLQAPCVKLCENTKAALSNSNAHLTFFAL
jgi:hypothetical protein